MLYLVAWLILILEVGDHFQEYWNRDGLDLFLGERPQIKGHFVLFAGLLDQLPMEHRHFIEETIV
jgi:hypothetical protein